MPENGDTALSRILSGSTIVLTGSIVNKIITFGGSVFIARLLGDTGYGVVVVALSIYFLLSGLLTMGLNGGIARNYPQVDNQREQRGILLTAFHIGISIGIVGSLSVFLAADLIAVYIFDDSSISLPLRLLAISLPFKIVLNLSNGSFQAVKRPAIKMAISSIVQPIIRILMIIALVIAGFRTAGVAGAYVIAITTAAILSLYYVRKLTSLFDFGRPAKTDYKELLSFSIPLVGSTILVDLMNNADTLLIGTLRVSAEVGQYNVAFVLSQATLLFFQTIGFMYIPEISELYANERIEKAIMIYRAITKWVVFISIPFILTAAAFPTYTLTLIYSSQYTTATVPFLVLIAGFVTHILNGPNRNTLIAFGDTRKILVFDAVAIVLNIVLNLSLIPTFGITGAAIATATAYLVRNTAMTWFLYRSYGIQPFSRWLLVPLTLVVIVAVILRGVFPNPTLLLVIVYTFSLTITITFGYLSSGIEEADLILSEFIEKNTSVDLKIIKRIHEKLR